MKLYKFLKVDNQELISDKLYNYVINHTDILETKYDWNTLNLKEVLTYVPELATESAKLVNSSIKMISIIYRNPSEGGKIHIDQGLAKYRLLWPVKNCQGSFTKFYDINGNKIYEKVNPNGNKFLTIEELYPFTEIGSLELTQPVIFNSKIPHGVYTNPMFTEPRLSATIGFGIYPIENYLI